MGPVPVKSRNLRSFPINYVFPVFIISLNFIGKEPSQWYRSHLSDRTKWSGSLRHSPSLRCPGELQGAAERSPAFENRPRATRCQTSRDLLTNCQRKEANR
jgi:hypothetical protein